MSRHGYRDLIAECPELFDNPDQTPIELLLDEEDIRAAEKHMVSKLQEQGLPEHWASVGVAFQDQYLRVVRDAVRFANGTLGTYIRTIPAHPQVPGVVVLPLLRSNVVLIRHFRHATRRWHLEVPRGFGSTGSTPEEDARRELEEEIKGFCRRLVNLGPVHLDTGLGAGYEHLFYAELESIGSYDADEGISGIFETPLQEFERMIAVGEITDGFTLAAYAKARTAGLLTP